MWSDYFKYSRKNISNIDITTPHTLCITLFMFRHDMCSDYFKYSHRNIYIIQRFLESVYVSSRVFEIDGAHVVPQHHLARHVAQKLRYRSRHYVVYVETGNLQWLFQISPQKHIKYRYLNASHAMHHVMYVTPRHLQWLFQILALKHFKYRYHNATHAMHHVIKQRQFRCNAL